MNKKFQENIHKSYPAMSYKIIFPYKNNKQQIHIWAQENIFKKIKFVIALNPYNTWYINITKSLRYTHHKLWDNIQRN